MTSSNIVKETLKCFGISLRTFSFRSFHQVDLLDTSRFELGFLLLQPQLKLMFFSFLLNVRWERMSEYKEKINLETLIFQFFSFSLLLNDFLPTKEIIIRIFGYII